MRNEQTDKQNEIEVHKRLIAGCFFFSDDGVGHKGKNRGIIGQLHSRAITQLQLMLSVGCRSLS